MDDYLKRNKEMAREMENWSKKNPGKSSADFWNLKPKKEAKSAKSKALEGKLTEEGKRRIQNFGAQHPYFHSKEMKQYRRLLRDNDRLRKADKRAENDSVREGNPRYKDA